jgi:hypothetical protein
MKIKGLVWLGTRISRFVEMLNLFQIEFIVPIETAEDGNAWSHFRAPDGFIYELTYTPDHPLLRK